jgi:hypothetical protein
VRWAARRSRPAGSADGAPAAGGLDSLNWALLAGSVMSAHRGDAGAHVAALRRLERDVPAGARVGAYLWYLLRYRVVAMLGRRPGPEDVRELARRFWPEFAKLIRGDHSQLEDTLLTVFRFAAEDRKVKGGRAIVMVSAALGVLLDDPETELAAMRPHLAQWWRTNADEFRDLGAG